MGYTKLWQEIVTSSIWSADDKVRIMWITMLASADAAGFVPGSIPGMAKIANMSLPDGERALHVLESEDKYSRSADFGGRRIEWVEGEGGWLVLNFERFRERRDAEKNREYMRGYMRDRRAEEKRHREGQGNE